MRATVTLLILLTLFSQTALARDDTQLNLPDGAKARFGKGEITEIAFAPDSNRLAVASSIGIWIYDAHTGEELALLTGHTRSVISVAFSPDGRTLASGSSDETIRLWDATTNEHRQTLRGHTSWVNSVAFSPDGRTLASGGGDKDNTIRLWDAMTGTHKDTFIGHTGTVTSVAFSPDGKTLLSGSSDGTARLWDVATGVPWQIDMEHKETVTSVAFSPNGSTLASGSLDDTIRMWNVGSSVPKHILTGHEYGISTVAFSPDGETLASGGYREIRLWDADSGIHKTTLTGHAWGVSSVAFSPDGRTLASGGWENRVNLWDAATGGHRQTLTEYTMEVTSVAFSPDGRTLATGHQGFWGSKTLRLWDVPTGEHRQTLIGHRANVRSVVFSPDGRTLATGSDDETVRLWEATTGALRRTLRGHRGAVRSVAFSPDGRTLASVGSRTIRLWDRVTGTALHILTGQAYVTSVAFSPDGRTLATGGWREDQTIRLWDVATGEHWQTLIGYTLGVSCVTFSPDGRMLASGGLDGQMLANNRWKLDPTIRLWDAVTSEHKLTLTGHESGASSIAFSPDGRTLASGGGARTIDLWDVATGKHRHTITGHTSRINSIAFSPEGGTLASGNEDGTVLLWELTPSVNANAIVRLTPSPVQSPGVSVPLTFSLNITDGVTVAGYQATVAFDTSALRYVSSANGDYLPTGAFFVPPVVEENQVTLAATTLDGTGNGDGTLAVITFEVVAVKVSMLPLLEVNLVGLDGERWFPGVSGAQVIEPPEIFGDVNRDGVVNIQDLTVVGANFGQTGENGADVNRDGVVDIVDLVVVADAIRNAATAPAAHPHALGSYGTGDPSPTAADVQGWLAQARGLDLTDATVQRGVIFLEQLLAALTPKETALLPNYPNPFNPETWIPYHLAHAADVQITIYDTKGVVVRRLKLGHQPVGIYQERSRAAYWNGRNTSGEWVASGVYFYQLRAGDYTALRRMVVVK